MASIYHKSLERNSRAIRILTLLPGPVSAPIECQLKRVFLGDHPVYEAVSYAWGNQEDTKSLLVQGVEVRVPSNLETCLRYLRKPDETLQLWVDSVCINQQNLEEKELQIGMMEEIFRCCASVYIWLGVPKKEGPTEIDHEFIKRQASPFTMIHHFSKNQHLHELSCFRTELSTNQFLFHNDPAFKRIWESFKDILQKPWWSRLWCVQECLLPPSATVVLGHWRLSWETLKLGQLNYTRHVRSCCAKVSGLMPLDYIFHPDMTVFHTRLDSSAMSIVPSDPSVDLDQLLRSFPYKACKDPRDKVYGILGLVNRSRYPEIVVNYSLDTKTVYINTMSAILLNGKGDLRCLTGIGFDTAEHGDLPSWVRNFGARPSIESVSQELKRRQSYSLYNASSSTDRPPTILNKSLLCLHGVCIDKVLRVGRSIERRSWRHVHDVIRDWSVLANVEIPADISSELFYESKSNAFWRTIVGDRLFRSDESIRRIHQGDMDGLRLWLSGMLNAIKMGAEPPLEPWLRTMVSFTYGRGMFLTENGYLGLCYPNCQPGEQVWALHGGRVPFILRPHPQLHKRGVTSENQYKFMGEGYLHGFMDGEILKPNFSRTEEVVLC